jgi:hypothetical protein
MANKEQATMPQEQVNSNQTQRDEPTSYSIGYEEVPHYRDASFGAPGLKLSERAGDKGPTAGQRLALAIVSLVLLLVKPRHGWFTDPGSDVDQCSSQVCGGENRPMF